MKILVCVKHVPDTETRVKVKLGGLSLDLADANWVINPYDEYAVEEALQLKEKLGGEVTVVTMGGEKSTKTLRTALAMGADRAILLNDPAFEGGDAMTTGKVLAAAIKQQQPFDLILCGKHGVGDDNQQVGSLLGQLLGIPTVTVVTGLEVDGTKATCMREIEGGTEVFTTGLPAVITCQKGLNEPRYPSLRGIMQAKKKPVSILGLSELGLDVSSVGAAGRAFELKGYSLPPERAAGRMLEGKIPDQSKEIVGLLHGEAKVI